MRKIRFDNVSLQYRKSEVQQLRNIDLTINVIFLFKKKVDKSSLSDNDFLNF